VDTTRVGDGQTPFLTIELKNVKIDVNVRHARDLMSMLEKFRVFFLKTMMCLCFRSHH
jgi:hypothetical protein